MYSKLSLKWKECMLITSSRASGMMISSRITSANTKNSLLLKKISDPHKTENTFKRLPQAVSDCRQSLDQKRSRLFYCHHFSLVNGMRELMAGSALSAHGISFLGIWRAPVCAWRPSGRQKAESENYVKCSKIKGLRLHMWYN